MCGKCEERLESNERKPQRAPEATEASLDAGQTGRCRGQRTGVSPVGQGLEGGVHVAGVANVLQPSQA